MRSAVFISSGIGNALMLVPLIKQLKLKGDVTAISTSPFHAEQIFDGFEDELFTDVEVIQSNVDRLRNSKLFQRKFDRIYLDHFAASRRNIILAHTNSKEIHTPTIPPQLPSIFQKKLTHHEPSTQDHEATRYLKMVHPKFENKDLHPDLFKLKAKSAPRLSEKAYITIQPGSGNNITPWKTLEMDKWVQTITWFIEQYPELNVVILGDENETELARHFPKLPQVVNAIGATALTDLPGILADAQLHLGNDSALMHLAGCLGVPTVTTWGGSDPDFYGWNLIDAENHHIIYKKPSCAPCSRWLEPNTSRVELPSLCPDFKCLGTVRANDITKLIQQVLKR